MKLEPHQNIDSSLSPTVERLCKASQKAASEQHNVIRWKEKLPHNSLCFSPELISLYGSEVWENLTEEQRLRLAFFECINFFSLNIHGEKSLIEGLARKLYAKGNQVVTPYLHHFLDEENKHMTMFGGYCMRYAGKIYPEKKMAFEREYAPGEEEFLFFAKILVFEEIVDAYNKCMAQDERIEELTRQINFVHHRDEARHLVFGRAMTVEIFNRHKGAWAESGVLVNIQKYLRTYIDKTWQEYLNPQVYKDAGLANAYELYQKASVNPQLLERRRAIAASLYSFFEKEEILVETPCKVLVG